MTIGQELAKDLGHHPAGLCQLEDEVHVTGGLLLFSSRWPLFFLKMRSMQLGALQRRRPNPLGHGLDCLL